MYFFWYTVFGILLVISPKYSFACNGFEFRVVYFKNCGSNNVINFKNPNVVLDKDCNVTPSGCFSTAGFKTAMIHYRAEKKPVPAIEGDFDMCKALQEKDEYVLMLATIIGIPTSCPMTKQESCQSGKEKVSIAKFKNKLGLALGVSTVNLTITHDTGETCVTLSAEFKKPRRHG